MRVKFEKKNNKQKTKNKATLVACGWTEAVMEKVTGASEQEQ